ncbi:UNVERIFIED_CONTAM: hypothetical protein Sradi_5073000 [Sesamum radiatum]|uniref:Reverse transcriptase zinc-binding domain-containing protein n=1 Tax=Sesamum radiatum TaxID=300843 RepID=A0AAW2M0D6_SESRA
MRSTSEGLRFGTGSRRRVTLPPSMTCQDSDRIITDFRSTEAAVQHLAEWSNSKGFVTFKAYEYFRPKLTRQSWKASIWKTFIPPKYSFILWFGLWERLETRDRLAFLQEDPSCALCIMNRPNISSSNAP